MLKRSFVPAIIAVVLLSLPAFAQYAPWLYWTFLPKAEMDEIVGESSGETAWNTIAEINAFNRQRFGEEFSGNFLETQVVVRKLKSYGLEGVDIVTYPGGPAWVAVKGELWETKPGRVKLASINDMLPMLASGSATGRRHGRARLGRPRHAQGDHGGQGGRQDRRDRRIADDGLRRGHARRALSGWCRSACPGPISTRSRSPGAGSCSAAGPAGRRPDSPGRRSSRGSGRPSGGGAAAARGRSAGAGLRLPAPGPRGRHPQAPAPGQRKDHRQGQGRVEDGDGRPRERRLPHPRHGPGGGRDHPLGPPLRGLPRSRGPTTTSPAAPRSSRSPASSTP